MVLDHLHNAGLYLRLHERLARAFDCLRQCDLLALPQGRVEIERDDIFALVQDYQTRPREQCVWEAHRKYWDVQYVARGTEQMGYAYLPMMRVRTPYDSTTDVEFFDGDGDFITVAAGMFAIFAPSDVHMPGVALTAPGNVRKVVVKIAAPAG